MSYLGNLAGFFIAQGSKNVSTIEILEAYFAIPGTRCPPGGECRLKGLGLGLVALAINNARNSGSVFCKPAAHFRNAPVPFKRMCIEAIVFGPRSSYMLSELVAAAPRAALEIMEFESVQE
jgi:hypothetical protein